METLAKISVSVSSDVSQEGIFVEKPFTKARSLLEQLVGQLQSPELLRTTHSELEKYINESGRELMRQLVQDQFELRSIRENKHVHGVVGADGLKRSEIKQSSCTLKTIFGRAKIKRLSYGAPGLKSLKPMDGELNLPNQIHSFGMQRRLAQEISKNSFEEVQKYAQELSGEQIGKRQIEQIAISAAKDFEKYYGMQSKQARAALDKVFSKEKKAPAEIEKNESNDSIILTTDGKGIVVLERDLREATKKAAARKRKKEINSHKKHRLSRGEKSSRKRTAQVAAVYSIAPYQRTGEDIIRDLHHLQPENNQPNKRPRPQNKRVWASVVKEASETIEEAFNEALRRDLMKKKTWAILVDGGEDQLKIINKMARKYKVRPKVILDFIHVSEYLWKAVTSFCKEGSAEAESWVTERLLAILKGKSSQVAAGIRRSATLKKLPANRQKPVDKCANYLLKNREHFRYDEYLKQGLPIASGVIEGACRHLIKDRLDITGARWTVATAEAVLKLRAIRSSGDFEEYWKFHEEQEFRRNHLPNAIISLSHEAYPRLRLVKT